MIVVDSDMVNDIWLIHGCWWIAEHKLCNAH